LLSAFIKLLIDNLYIKRLDIGAKAGENHMSVGDNIRKQREAKGLTQKDLADKLFVTPQAVSRWEKGDVEPSVDALKGMSAIFGVSIDELVDDGKKTEESEKEIEPVTSPTETPTPAPVSAPEPRLLGVCVRCGKAIYDNETYATGSKAIHHTGRGHHHETISYHLNNGGTDLFCSSCAEIYRQADAESAQFHGDEVAHIHSKAWGWGIFSGVVTLILAIIIGVALLRNNNQSGGIWTLCLSPLFAYALFSLVFVLISDNTFVSELFMELVSFGFVKMPGVIFSLDFDGLVFLVVAKILLGIIAFMIIAFAFAFAVGLSSLFSMFMFPVALQREPGSN
jgi:transcriptional regulator with XRE-family HTH domain